MTLSTGGACIDDEQVMEKNRRMLLHQTVALKKMMTKQNCFFCSSKFRGDSQGAWLFCDTFGSAGGIVVTNAGCSASSVFRFSDPLSVYPLT
jgi:hypothetical protein